MDDRRYKLSYDVKHDTSGFTKEDLQREGRGGCDALIVHSIIRPADGSYSLASLSIDGDHGGEVTIDEVFKVWTMLASTLADCDALTPGKRTLCQHVITAVREAMGLV